MSYCSIKKSTWLVLQGSEKPRLAGGSAHAEPLLLQMHAYVVKIPFKTRHLIMCHNVEGSLQSFDFVIQYHLFDFSVEFVGAVISVFTEEAQISRGSSNKRHTGGG